MRLGDGLWELGTLGNGTMFDYEELVISLVSGEYKDDYQHVLEQLDFYIGILLKEGVLIEFIEPKFMPNWVRAVYMNY